MSASTSKWFDCVLMDRPVNKKTNSWAVWARDGESYLGEVKWYAPWRQYCFFPAGDTIWNAECLSDIGTFTGAQTRFHRTVKADADVQV